MYVKYVMWTRYVHFQCYVLQGIAGWNEDRASAALMDRGGNSQTSSYSSPVKHEINYLSKMVNCEELQKNFDHPSKYISNMGCLSCKCFTWSYLLSINRFKLTDKWNRVH